MKKTFASRPSNDLRLYFSRVITTVSSHYGTCVRRTLSTMDLSYFSRNTCDQVLESNINNTPNTKKLCNKSKGQSNAIHVAQSSSKQGIFYLWYITLLNFLIYYSLVLPFTCFIVKSIYNVMSRSEWLYYGKYTSKPTDSSVQTCDHE